MKTEVDELPDDPAFLKLMLVDLLSSLSRKDQQLDRLAHQLALLKRHIYGRRSERLELDPDQQKLFDQVEAALASSTPQAAAAESTNDEPPAKGSPKKKGHGRRPLPPELRRERVEHVLAEDQCVCTTCSKPLRKIGEETSEELEYKPASMYVIEHVRFKYSCASCQDAVVTAPTAIRPVEKGVAGPGLLAHVVTSKYADHTPLNRLEGIFARSGVHISRKTMCDWVDRVASLMRPIYVAMIDVMLQSMVLHVDDTPVPVLDPALSRTRIGRLWVYVGDRDHPLVLYDYRPDRKGAGPVKFLGGYRGYLQVDAYSGYDKLFRDGAVVEVGCWAHARRKFYDSRETDQLRAQVAIAYIRKLYDVETEADVLELDPATPKDIRKQLRQDRSLPILMDLKVWLDKQTDIVLARSPIGEAIRYALNQWTGLVRYVEDGRLAIDNNPAERELRRVAIGRKNWTFAGSDAGGDNAAILYSLIASCRRHKVEPWAYLRDMLTLVSTHPASRIDELLPNNYRPAASSN